MWELLLAVAVLQLSACGPMTFVVGVNPGDQRLTSTVVQSDDRLFSARVAIVDVSGLIVNSNRNGLLRQGENPVALLRETLDAAAADAQVKAVILRINSPGGAVTASDAMYREVIRFRERSGKPVVALLMDVAASGGYYLACGADRIVAYPTSVTGSIGVIMQTLSVKPGLTRIGVLADAITSGPNKDAGSPLSTLTPEQRAVLQQLVDDFYARFVAVVRQRRPGIEAANLALVTDGRVFSGEQAAALGLVDRTGDLEDAFAEAKQRAGLGSADLMLFHRPLRHVGSPYAATPTSGVAEGTQINLAQINLDASGGGLVDAPVGFYYLWAP
jgi:protease-4